MSRPDGVAGSPDGGALATTGGPGPVVGPAGPADGAGSGRGESLAAAVLDACRRRGLSLAVAESLTGGLVCATLVQVPGASTVVRGAVVAYATELKTSVLGVDAVHLARTGPVDAEVSRQMAAGVAGLLGADVGLATTGVAGPGPADGHKAGSVHVAVVTPSGGAHRELHVPGSRDEVREAAVTAVLDLARAAVGREGLLPDR